MPVWLRRWPPLDRGSLQRLLFALAAIAVLAAAVLAAPAAIAAVKRAVKRLPGMTSRPVRPLTAEGLLYTVGGDENAASFVVAPAGAPLRLPRGDGDQTAALASPDGSRVLYLASACPRCSLAYELRDLSSGAVAVVGTAPARSAATARLDAAWSPDGRQIAFAEQGLDSPSPRIFVLDQATGVRRALSPNDAEEQTDPVWSPDGHSVAYLAGGEASVVIVIDAGSGEARVLNDRLDHATDLAWSPDGRYLSVLRQGELWLVEAANGHGFRLQVPARVIGFGGWSPGSRSLLVTATELPSVVIADRVLVVPVDGYSPVRLGAPGTVGDARWSADGRTIAWVATAAGHWTIWSASAAGGAAKQLTSGTGAVRLDSWR